MLVEGIPMMFILLATMVAVFVIVRTVSRAGRPRRAEQYICRACGASHPQFARFCRRCGKQL